MSLITLENLPNSSARQVIDSLLSDTFNSLPADGIARPAIQSGCAVELYDTYDNNSLVTKELRAHYAKCAAAISASTGYSNLETNIDSGVSLTWRTRPTSGDADDILWSAWQEGELRDAHFIITANPNGSNDYWKSAFNAHSDVFNVVREQDTDMLRYRAMAAVGMAIYDTGTYEQFNALVEQHTGEYAAPENVELDCYAKTTANATHRTKPGVAAGSVDWIEVIEGLHSASDGSQGLFAMHEEINNVQTDIDGYGAWRTGGGHGAYAIRFGLKRLMTEVESPTQYQYVGNATVMGVEQTIDMINNVTVSCSTTITNRCKDRLRYIKVNGL